MDKREARALALDLRKEKDKKESSDKVVSDILSSHILDSYSTIGIYYPIGREIDIMPLLSYYPDKRFYLPITRDEIAFIEYKKDDALKDGPFHTKEPMGNITSRDEIECFIIPCVGIGKDLKRIGYGKGYYDRYLKDYSGMKIGISYDNAIFDVLMSSFDLVMNKVFKG